MLVIGGGLVGSAVGFGVAERGARVIVLDEGDRAFRAATGNAGLVWYQGKGRGMPRYQQWSLEATQAWPQFAQKVLSSDRHRGLEESARKGMCRRIQPQETIGTWMNTSIRMLE